MAITSLLSCSSSPIPISSSPHNPKPSSQFSLSHATHQIPSPKKPTQKSAIAGLAGVAGLTAAAAMVVAPAAFAAAPDLPLQLAAEPSNALSLPTWAIHVSSVVEWILAMALVWEYGEKPGYESWKGLSWGMVLVALQGALTVIGNFTMCIAAYRIYKSSQERSENN